MTDTSSFIPYCPIILVGMMGAGKTAVGRRLAMRLRLPFIDSDTEIEAAAGMTITQYFERYGEPAFRDGERRVIARLVDGPPCVLSTGGGAFVDEATRARIAAKGISIWLKVNLEILLTRTARRDDRPLLKGGNPRELMTSLLREREPVYAQADITIVSEDRPVDETVDRALNALHAFQKGSIDS